MDGKHTFFSNNFFMCGFHQCSFITLASISNPSYLSHRCFIIHGGSVGGFQSRPWNPAGNPGRKKSTMFVSLRNMLYTLVISVIHVHLFLESYDITEKLIPCWIKQNMHSLSNPRMKSMNISIFLNLISSSNSTWCL